MSHIPVLLKEVIQFLNPKPGDFIIDGTVDGGGHAVEILKKILPDGRLLGTDLDESLLKTTESRISTELKIADLKKNLKLVQGNYADLPEILRRPDLVSWVGAPKPTFQSALRQTVGAEASEEKLPKADGLLLDLGFSSEQLDSGKGFSFLKDEVLDMRYSGEGMTAAEIVNSFSEKDLADIFWKYGEERYSRQIAKKIVEERKKERILTTERLVEIVKKAVPRNYEKGRINPATRVFQALRIYVNDELGNLAKLLGNLDKILKIKGRVAIISFHSLEDRLVKNYFRDSAKSGKMEILTKKPITASEEEIKINPRSRSAKMRAAIILKNQNDSHSTEQK